MNELANPHFPHDPALAPRSSSWSMAPHWCPSLMVSQWPRVGAEASDSSSRPRVGRSLRTAPRCTSIDIEAVEEQQAQSETFCWMPQTPAVHLLGLFIFFFCQTIVAFDCSSSHLHLASGAAIFSIACRAISITPWHGHNMIFVKIISIQCAHTAI